MSVSSLYRSLFPEELYGLEDPRLVEVYSELGHLYTETRELSQAEEMYDRALPLIERQIDVCPLQFPELSFRFSLLHLSIF